MADRYWVAGTGTWNDTDGTKWATTSGGAGGASRPTSSDNAIFDDNSNPGGSGASYTVTISLNNEEVLDLSLSNPSAGTLTTSGAGTRAVFGNLFVESGVIWNHTGNINFSSTATGKTITTNGVTVGSDFNFNGVGGGWTLADALTNNSKVITLNNGSFDDGGFAINSGTFQGSNSNTRSLTLSGLCTLDDSGGAWGFANSTNMTLTHTGTIKLTNPGTGTTTFSGGGLTYNNLWGDMAATGIFEITGSNTFNNLEISNAPLSIRFGSNTTNTFESWDVSGTPGNLIEIRSVGGTSNHNLVKTGGGVVSCDYMNISRSNASPANTWYAGNNSTDGGNNTGWIFTDPPAPANTGAMLMLF